MSGLLLMTAAGLCLLTAGVHSLLGERRLIVPLLASRQAVLASPLAREITRFAWHWTTLLWLLVGMVLLLAGLGEPTSTALLWAIGITHLGAGLFDGILTRGKHVGWPLITLIGVLTLLALLLSR